MDHYYKQFISNTKRISLREQATQATLIDKRISESDLQLIKDSNQYYFYRKSAIRVLPLFITGFYVVSGLAMKRSPFLIREILLISSVSLGVLYLDHLNSEHFWEQSRDLVKQYTNYSDMMVMDEKRLEEMRQNYSRQKSPVINSVINSDKQDGMYDD